MSGIKQAVEKVLESNAYKKALDGEGDKDLEMLLIQLCYVVYDRTKYSLLRKYGKVKFFTSEHIKVELNSVAPPTDINLNTNI